VRACLLLNCRAAVPTAASSACRERRFWPCCEEGAPGLRRGCGLGPCSALHCTALDSKRRDPAPWFRHAGVGTPTARRVSHQHTRLLVCPVCHLYAVCRRTSRQSSSTTDDLVAWPVIQFGARVHSRTRAAHHQDVIDESHKLRHIIRKRKL